MREKACITDFTPNGLVVFVMRIGLEGDVGLKVEWVDEVTVRTENGEVLMLYDNVLVEIDIAFENFRKTIKLSFVEKIR